MSYIAEQVDDIIKSLRAEAYRLLDEAKDIEDAWGDYDFDFLVNHGVISPREREIWEEEMEARLENW